MNKGFELREIKSAPITENELNNMKEIAGSYAALFSKMARKYKELQLSQKVLSEEEVKHYILSDYTFLKRPVIIFGNNIFVGNSANVIKEAKSLISWRDILYPLHSRLCSHGNDIHVIWKNFII